MDPDTTQDSEQKFSWKEGVWEIGKFLFLAAIIVAPIRLYIAQPYLVSGASMDPTFQNGDYLIIDELSYHLSEPKRGDVIVFRYPQKPSLFFIKRIIGLPGEIIKSSNGRVTVYTKENQIGFPVDESYLPKEYSGSFSPIQLEKTEYFVMGDNRDASLDSRAWGALPENNIIGKVFVRLFPPQRISFSP